MTAVVGRARDGNAMPQRQRDLAGAIRDAAIYLCLYLVGALFLVPLAIVLMTSMRPAAEIAAGNLISLPKSFDLSAWGIAWNTTCVGSDCRGLSPYFLNSLAFVIPATMISTALGSITGYALTKFPFRGSGLLYAAVMFGIFLPGQVYLLPMAQFLGLFHLANVYGLVLVHTVFGLGFTTLFFRNYYVQIPDDLIRAARIDGAGVLRIYRRIIVPLSPPMITVAVIWQFTHIWNEFLYGATFTSGQGLPLTAALYTVTSGSTGVHAYNVEAAAVIIAALPTLAIYVFAGRFFVRGLTAGAVKG